jgi:hypothetical protein
LNVMRLLSMGEVALNVMRLLSMGEVALNVMRLLSMGEVALNAAGVAAAGNGLLIKAMGKMPKMIIMKIFGFCAHIVPNPENPYFLPLT